MAFGLEIINSDDILQLSTELDLDTYAVISSGTVANNVELDRPSDNTALLFVRCNDTSVYYTLKVDPSSNTKWAIYSDASATFKYVWLARISTLTEGLDNVGLQLYNASGNLLWSSRYEILNVYTIWNAFFPLDYTSTISNTGPTTTLEKYILLNPLKIVEGFFDDYVGVPAVRNSTANTFLGKCLPYVYTGSGPTLDYRTMRYLFIGEFNI